MRRPPLPHAAARSVLTALLCAIPAIAHGADLHAFVGLDSGGVRARAVLADLRVTDPGLAGDRFDVGVARAEGAASTALGWRRTAVAGPVGNLVIEGAMGIGLAAPGGPGAGGPAASGGLRAGVELGARGVAGPVALAVRATYGNRVPFAWPELGLEAAAAPPADPRLRTGAGAGDPVAAASVSAAWRIDRAWTLTVAPSAARTDSGWTAALDAALRRYGIAHDLDLSVRADAATGSRARHAALGATLHHVPRRAPESRATVWLGAGDDGVAGGEGLALGGELAWQVRAGASEAGIAAGWAPFRSDRPAGYAALQASAPMATGRARVVMAWTGTSWMASLGWSQALPR